MADWEAKQDERIEAGLIEFNKSASKLAQHRVIPGPKPRYYIPNGTGWLEDYDLPLPGLYLACRLDVAERAVFSDQRAWFAITHQTGGHACHHPEAIVTPLLPKAEVWPKMIKLAKKWYASNAGLWGVTLDDLVEYRQDINELFNADCNLTYTEFEEGWYPIDYSADTLQELCPEENVGYPDDHLQFETLFEGFLGSMNRWKLLILGENSD